MKRCQLCGGTKRIKGMGGIDKLCTECDGIGYVKNSEDILHCNEVKVSSKVNDTEVTTKRRGRPRMIKSTG